MHFTLLVDAIYPYSYPLALHSVKSEKKNKEERKTKNRPHLHHKVNNAFF